MIWIPELSLFVIQWGNNGFFVSSDGITWQDIQLVDPIHTQGKPTYLSPYLYIGGQGSDYGPFRGLALQTIQLGAPMAVPYADGTVFLDSPSFLYGFAGSLRGTLGNQGVYGGDLYGFAGVVDGGVDSDPGFAGDLYGFAGVIDGYGGADADLYGFAGTMDGAAVMPETTYADLYGFAGVVAGNLADVALFAADLYGFAGGLDGETGAEGHLYGFAGVVDGTLTDVAWLQGDLYGFAGTVAGTVSDVAWLQGSLYGFAGAMDSAANGAAGDLYGFAGTFSGAFAVLDGQGLLNVDLHDAATVMNVHTLQTTRYRNFQFGQLLTVGGTVYGVKTTGLYALRADLDNDAGAAYKVNASITTKDTDFGVFQAKRVPYCYLNSDTQTKITPSVDSVAKLPHLSAFNGRKTHLARGPSGRYWQFKLEAIVKVEGAEFLPEQRQRRVK